MSESGRVKNFRKLRYLYNKTVDQMSAILGLPVETIKKWDCREEECPDYIISIIKYRIDNKS